MKGLNPEEVIELKQIIKNIAAQIVINMILLFDCNGDNILSCHLSFVTFKAINENTKANIKIT